MASLSAFLHILNEQYALRDACTGLEQAVHWRTGFPRSKVTNSLMVLELLVQEGAALDKLVDLAASNTKTADGYIDYLRTDLAGTHHHWWFRRAYCVRLFFYFNSLGLDGEPSVRVWVVLSPAEQGYARGTGAAFVAPTSKGYEYKPAQAAVQPSQITHTPEQLAKAARLGATVKKSVSTELGYTPGSPEHKAAQRAFYLAEKARTGKPAKDYAAWEKSYETVLRNNRVGYNREREYQQVYGGVSKMLKTPHTLRQVDIFVKEKRYCGQLKTGPLYLRKQEIIDLQKDAFIIKRMHLKVEYILERGASKPLLKALEKIGATYKIGPQI